MKGYHSKNEVGNDEDNKREKEEADLMYNIFSNIQYLSPVCF
jgi:hypothetical protein